MQGELLGVRAVPLLSPLTPIHRVPSRAPSTRSRTVPDYKNPTPVSTTPGRPSYLRIVAFDSR